MANTHLFCSRNFSFRLDLDPLHCYLTENSNTNSKEWIEKRLSSFAIMFAFTAKKSSSRFWNLFLNVHFFSIVKAVDKNVTCHIIYNRFLSIKMVQSSVFLLLKTCSTWKFKRNVFLGTTPQEDLSLTNLNTKI